MITNVIDAHFSCIDYTVGEICHLELARTKTIINDLLKIEFITQNDNDTFQSTKRQVMSSIFCHIKKN